MCLSLYPSMRFGTEATTAHCTLSATQDRIALFALLRFRSSADRLIVISTHLTRNPEDLEKDQLRVKQLGQACASISCRGDVGHM